jgi:hypothetical protein
MSGPGFQVDDATMEAVSGQLRAGADELGVRGEPPAQVKAGLLTAVFAAMGAHLAQESEKLVGQLGGSAEAVQSAAESYAQIDADAQRNLRPEYEKPGWDPGPVPPGAV